MNSGVNKKNIHDLSELRGLSSPGSTIVAIGGGKGGIGKSFISSSLAIFLSQLGYETTAIDLDLGSANLHTSLGLPISNVGINEFIRNPQVKLEDVSQKTHWPKLKLIPGSSDALDMANISEAARSRLMSAIFNHKSDFTILDLSAGTHGPTLDFFLMAHHKVVIFTPDPSSIENAYRFMKASFYNRVRRYEHQLHMKDQVLQLIEQAGQGKLKNPAQFMAQLAQRDPHSAMALRALFADMNMGIIVNQARTQTEVELGQSLQSVCTKFFGFTCEFLGGLEYDNAVWQSLRQRNHLLMANRQTHLYAQLMSIARKLSKFRQSKIAA